MSLDLMPRGSRLSIFREKLHSATRHVQKRDSKADVKSETRQNGNPSDASQPHKGRAEAQLDETNKEAVPAFDYTPLKPDQIRLVTLYPGSGELMCSLTVVDIPKEGRPSAMPPYNGVSYVWGGIKRPHSVKCNYSDAAMVQGTHCNFLTLNTIQHVKVTSNLKARLLRLRDYEEWGTFWIDSICTYSHRTATKHLGTMRFAPQSFEVLNLRIWLVRSDNTFVRVFNLLSLQP